MSSSETNIPASVQLALDLLQKIEAMVEATLEQGYGGHDLVAWYEQMTQAASAAQWAYALVHGPMDKLSDEDEHEMMRRARVLGSHLLEAALWPQRMAIQAGQGARPHEVRHRLMQWLRMGPSWPESDIDGKPLRDIAQMIDRTVSRPEDALATRLGLLTPLWLNLALWVKLDERLGKAESERES